jgi:hypothetical protein
MMPDALKTDDIDPALQSRLLLEEISRRGGGVGVSGGGGKWVVTRDAPASSYPKTMFLDLNPTSWYSYVEGEGVCINHLGPVVYNGGFKWPTVDGNGLLTRPKYYIPVGNGLKIYAKITGTVTTSTFVDPNNGNAPKSYQTGCSVSGYTVEYGDYTFFPASTAGITNLGAIPTGAFTMYLLLLRIDADGNEDPVTGADRLAEFSNNNNFDGFVDSPFYDRINLNYGPRSEVFSY